MKNITLEVCDRRELYEMVLAMSENYLVKKLDNEKFVCLRKHKKTLVKLSLTHNKSITENFVIDYEEDFTERHIEEYAEYRKALIRLVAKDKCRNMKTVMVQTECSICSYTNDGDFFLHNKLFMLNHYSVESLVG